MHYGILRRSGRYPWGSGENAEERSRGFLGYVDDLRAKGVSEVDIAKGLDVTTTALRAARAIAKNETRKADTALALRLKNSGMSNVAIGARMKIAESSVRQLLNPALTDKQNILHETADLLKSKVGVDKYLDIGAGVESHLGISATKLSTAVAMLREAGYEVHNVQVDQLGTGNKTTIKVLAEEGVKYVDIVTHPERIGSIAAYSEDGGRSYEDVKPPVNVSSKRIEVKYAEDGGASADGVIYLRPGTPDLSLGSARYAQVRIAVDGTHYLKGMAMYKDDLPAGVDMQFNTNKSNTGNKLDAMKPQKDEENPFGSTVRQKTYIDKDGKEKQSPLNIVNEEGNWKDWSRTLSSQVLSKQSVGLAKKQLDLSLSSKVAELDEINRLTNPVVKQSLLESYADSADSASVHLKAAALPRQGTHVILPNPDLKESEIYAPNYKNGEKVALVRFPHGGTFEIPEVTVNNKHASSRAALGNAIDAVAIHPKVAERLSGADFDGDTVLVIPNDKGTVKTSAPLSGLKDFDPKQSYPAYDGMTPMSSRAKQQQMGDVSNLITDMSIKGAKPDELARAVRHSMVVIDAEKHNLNYKQSYVDNGIASLKEKYQGRGATGRLSGASTIVSRASSEVRVADRKLRPASEGGSVDKETGAKVFKPTDETFVDRQGRTVVKTTRSTKLAEADDAHKLSSGMPIETVYANHSNALKSLANQARKSALETKGVDYSPTANKVHASEVASLNAKLNLALKNKPLERQAQLLANSTVSAKRAANPHMDPTDLKKIKGQALDTARARVGAAKQQVYITDPEWAAIQSGAVSTNKLKQVLDNADQERVRQLATPRAATVMTPAKLAIAKERIASGYTQAEVAASLGVPVSTLNSSLLR
jgi:hypothetical protein